MLLSTQTHNFNLHYDMKKTVKFLKDAGYDAYDLSLFIKEAKDELIFNDNYLENAKALREYADSIGIVCNQSHATFPTSSGDEKRDAEIFDEVVRDMEVAAILGAKAIVVHPKKHLCYAEHAEELFNMNVEFYKNLIPYCEKFGIKVATENMFQWNRKADCACDSTCSRAFEFCKYIDAVDSKWLVGCLDIGHTNLVDANLPEFIRIMGSKRLQALHVHDNDGKQDSHTLPYTKNMDFEAFTRALAEIGYKGDMTYEADNFFIGFPVELYPTVAEFMAKVGRHLIKEIEK